MSLHVSSVAGGIGAAFIVAYIFLFPRVHDCMPQHDALFCRGIAAARCDALERWGLVLLFVSIEVILRSRRIAASGLVARKGFLSQMVHNMLLQAYLRERRIPTAWLRAHKWLHARVDDKLMLFQVGGGGCGV